MWGEGEGGSIGSYMIGNLDAARDAAALRNAFGITTPIPSAGNPLSVWSINEETQADCLMSKFKAKMAQIAVSLNALPEIGASPSQRLNESLVAPPLEEINILHRPAREGSMRGIIRQIVHPNLTDAIARLPHSYVLLAQGRQSRTVPELVERYINRIDATHD